MIVGFKNYVDFNRRDENHILEAIEAAELAKVRGDMPVGSVLILPTKKVIDSNSVHSEGNVLNHSEINVIKKAIDLGHRRLSSAILYSTVEPCIMCTMVALEHGIQEIVFGAFDHKKGFATSGLLNLHHLPITYRGGILATECCDLLPSRLQVYIRENNEPVRDIGAEARSE
jgi:tRNA(Arg) A34 adenosine deaminase TadA